MELVQKTGATSRIESSKREEPTSINCQVFFLLIEFKRSYLTDFRFIAMLSTYQYLLQDPGSSSIDLYYVLTHLKEIGTFRSAAATFVRFLIVNEQRVLVGPTVFPHFPLEWNEFKPVQ